MMGVRKGEKMCLVGRCCWADSVKEPLMVAQEVCLGNTELEVQDIEVLPLNPTHVPFAENTGTERPMDVLECGVV